MASTTTRSSSLKSDEFCRLIPPSRDSTELKSPARRRVNDPIVFAAALHGVDDHRAVAPCVDHRRDQRRRMLQVRIDRDHGVAAARLADPRAVPPPCRNCG